MSNQDNEGKGSAGSGGDGTPPSPAQQVAQMRAHLRNTEAMAAEQQALRARMAQELARVTAERDRLRSAVAAAAPGAAVPPGPAGGTPATGIRFGASPAGTAPRSGPWRALATLGGIAAVVALLAWIAGTLPGEAEQAAASGAASAASAAPSSAPSEPATAAAQRMAAASAARAAFPLPPGVVALAPRTPDAPPTAAPAPAAAAVPPGMVARLRSAFAGEGIASPVDIDAATGRVSVADPQADNALRDRTDVVIRAVYAGASLPEPQIEHRWLSPMRGSHVAAVAPAVPAAPAAPVAPPTRPVPPAPAVTATPVPPVARAVPAPPVVQATPAAAAVSVARGATAVAVAPAAHPVAVAPVASGPAPVLSAAAAYAARHAPTPPVPPHAVAPTARPATVADAEDLRPVLPAGRVTAFCKAELAARPPAHRAPAMLACMKRSCCSTGNRQTEECHAFDKAYPFTCSAG